MKPVIVSRETKIVGFKAKNEYKASTIKDLQDIASKEQAGIYINKDRVITLCDE